MDVDEEQEGDEDDEEEDEDMDGSNADKSDDEDGTPKPRKKQPGEKKKRPRKSELNLAALTSEQAALAALNANEINKLRLQKRYYSEGLDFIRWINQAMELISSLLGSLNKAEVLDSMDFFRIVYQYEFEGSEVGISHFPKY
jgi:condensin complex subunit 1